MLKKQCPTCKAEGKELGSLSFYQSFTRHTYLRLKCKNCNTIFSLEGPNFRWEKITGLIINGEKNVTERQHNKGSQIEWHS